MSNVFFGAENTPELELFDRFTYADDAEEALVWYRSHRLDEEDHENALRMALEEVVPTTFLQTLEDRL